MTELSLNDGNWDTFHHQFIGVCMSKTMSVDAFRDFGFDPELFDEFPDIGGGHWVAGSSAEQRLNSGEAATFPFDDPLIDDVEGCRIDANGAGSVPFP
jgi:hypothetical protein